MAINKVDYPTDLTSQSDFSAHGELIETRFMDQSAAPIQVRDGVIPKGVVLQIGGVVYRADSDETITGTSSNYVKVVPGGATATAEYVTDLTGVSWDSQYNGYYDSSGNLYLFDEATARADGEISNERGRYVEKDDSGNVNIAGTFPLSRMEVFTASGTFTVPDGVSRVKATVVGGGGGGGGSGNDAEGVKGGNSTFEGLTGFGGDGGRTGDNLNDFNNYYGEGGGASGGDINFSGGSGTTSNIIGIETGDQELATAAALSGSGGSSYFGGGAPSVHEISTSTAGRTTNGFNSKNYGGGGGGGAETGPRYLRCGGGGGAGGCAIGFVSVSSGASISVTIGSGGAGGDNGFAVGGDGADGVVVIEY